MNRQHEIGPYWQDEDDWLCTIEFLPGDDPEGLTSASQKIGQLFSTTGNGRDWATPGFAFTDQAMVNRKIERPSIAPE